MVDMSLDVVNLSAGYGGRVILHAVSLRVGAGEVLAELQAMGVKRGLLTRNSRGCAATVMGRSTKDFLPRGRAFSLAGGPSIDGSRPAASGADSGIWLVGLRGVTMGMMSFPPSVELRERNLRRGGMGRKEKARGDVL